MTAAPLPAGIDAGLQLDQAPPLAVPAAFFLTAPVALVAAGALLVLTGGRALSTHWAPLTLALTHLGTLGFLAMVMFGALYQMTPVVAGVPVPAVRLGHAVHAALCVGVVGLTAGLIEGSRGLLLAGLGALALAALAFAIPVGVALARASARSATVWGMRLALAALVVAALLGLHMARGYAGLGFVADRGLWIQVHVTWAVLGWVGGLIVAVSWQVVPMFYLAPLPGPRACVATLVALAAGLLASSVALGLDPATRSPGAWAALGAAPAALAVWGVQPVGVLLSLRRRRRRRVDPSFRFWQGAMAVALLALPAALAAAWLPDPRAPLLLGWLVLWGWAAQVIHGMLTRIVPFLVWWHRFSPLIGRAQVPSMRSLYPRRVVLGGLAAHVVTLALGAAAILSGSDLAARATGVGVVATGLVLGVALARTLARRPADARA